MAGFKVRTQRSEWRQLGRVPAKRPDGEGMAGSVRAGHLQAQPGMARSGRFLPLDPYL